MCTVISAGNNKNLVQSGSLNLQYVNTIGITKALVIVDFASLVYRYNMVHCNRLTSACTDHIVVIPIVQKWCVCDNHSLTCIEC